MCTALPSKMCNQAKSDFYRLFCPKMSNLRPKIVQNGVEIARKCTFTTLKNAFLGVKF